MVQKAEVTIESLVSRREAARQAAASSPENAKIELLTLEGVAQKIRGKDATEVFADRDTLKDKRDANVRALSEELSQARRAARERETQEAAASLEAKTIEELEAMRTELTRQRKVIKSRLRSVSLALGKKQSAKTMADLWSKLSTEERKALLASANGKL